MKDIARTMSDQVLGLHPDHTVGELKKQLGVKQLELVVLESLDEYRGLLIEKTDPPWWRRRYVILAAALLLAAYLVTSMVFHPGVRLDHLARHLSVEVH